MVRFLNFLKLFNLYNFSTLAPGLAGLSVNSSPNELTIKNSQYKLSRKLDRLNTSQL